ncbi:sensor histidine kinase [Pseudidiomarina sp.]|uniref:sensor histidine kinase n=1 Tax=Pseudidiomarina sp. TaxID=2081707 RepID=UPI003A975F09
MSDVAKEDLNNSEFLELVFNTIPALAFVKNENYEIVKANDAFLDIYPPELRNAVIGSTTVESYSEEDREAFLAYDKLAFETGYSETIETILFPDGKIRKLLTKKRRFKAESGEAYILGIATDITRQEETLRKLEESNKDLNSFIHIASHDLKAPLLNIEQLISWINEEHLQALTPEVRGYFELIRSRAVRLKQLLNDLLLFSMSSQVTDDRYECFNVKSMASDVMSMLDSQHRFELEAEDVDVVLPRRGFEIVLRNLLSNALKHHDQEEGRITLSVSDSNHVYLIVVADNGPGIPAEFGERIFEMFTRLKSQDEVEGSGVGLAIVKRIIEKFGGSIRLRNSAQGAIFEISWPKQLAENQN